LASCPKCGLKLPESSNFCPNCGFRLESTTVPCSAEKACPKCGSVMRVGFMVERDSPLALWTLGEGIYWTPGEAGVMGDRVAIRAYACPQCGYVEHYVRRLQKDRDVILRAPTTTQE